MQILLVATPFIVSLLIEIIFIYYHRTRFYQLESLINKLERSDIPVEMRDELIRRFLNESGLSPRERGDFWLEESVRRHSKTPRD